MELSFDVNDILDDGTNEGEGTSFGTVNNTLIFGDNTNDLNYNESRAENWSFTRASSTVTTVGKHISECIGDAKANIDPLNGFSSNCHGNFSTAAGPTSNNRNVANFGEPLLISVYFMFI